MVNPDATIEVLITDAEMRLTLGAIGISETEWSRINYVDYIPVEPNGRPTAEMYESHGRVVAEAMQGVAVRALAMAGIL